MSRTGAYSCVTTTPVEMEPRTLVFSGLEIVFLLTEFPLAVGQSPGQGEAGPRETDGTTRTGTQMLVRPLVSWRLSLDFGCV